MKKFELMQEYEEAKKKGQIESVSLFIHMPTGETETITNPNVEEKLAYVDKTYNDDLVHANCQDIYIEDVYFLMAREDFDFSTAIHLLRDGLKVARKGWNGKGMYLFLANGKDIQSCTGIEDKCVDVICMKTAQDTVVFGWSVSQTDMLAEDWIVVE